MGDTFHACTLPWRIWPWGVTLTHSDTDMLPECSMEFGAMVVRPKPPYEQLWVKVDFEMAAFASAKPHRDDETLEEVTGYDIVPSRGASSVEAHLAKEAEWLRSGLCPDPGVYFSGDSGWLATSRRSWAERQRTGRSPHDAVHFLLDGRDGYVEILAAGFSWRAWRPGRSRRGDVTGEPVMSGTWIDRIGGDA
jgi:hypothetical protein